MVDKKNKEKLDIICSVIKETFPNPETELVYDSEFNLLVAIILSAQTTDRMVNIATKPLFQRVKTPEDILNIDKSELLDYFKVLNYYKTKTENIIKMADRVIRDYNGKIPDNFEDLITLDGVGRKTANVFLNIAHNKPTIAVDTHVFRVTNRIFGKKFAKPEQTEEFLLALNHHEFADLTHHLFILHGRYICKAIKPDCINCKIKNHCIFYQKKDI
jgi:endonuclease-3